MGRRSTLVAFAAVALAALLPVNAYAAVPATNVQVTVSDSTVNLAWTPDATDVPTGQAVLRDLGACGAAPSGSAVAVPGVVAASTFAVDSAVPNGTYCYYIESDSAMAPLTAYASAPATVNVIPPDTTAPIANTPVVTPANPVHGVATITASSNDPTATNQLYLGTTTCGLGSTAIASPWNSATVVDGTYLICNVATDQAVPTHNVSAPSAPATVVVDNTLPAGLVVTPAAGAFVRATITLTSSAADTSGIRSVQYQHAAPPAAGGTPAWANAGAIVTGPSATGFARDWATTGNGGAGGDGPELLRAVITDNAGNVTNTVQFTVNIDNTIPNVAPVLTAPPAVAGSPTMSWTAAHDANGISRYDVLRNGAVIGSVAPDQGLAFSDKNAPDQQTLSYTVRAYDLAGNFATSNADSVLVDSTAVSAPRALTATTPTASAPVLTWQPPATFAVNHYDIYRDGLLLASTTTPALTYTDATADEGPHDYAVLARTASAQAGVLSASFKVIYDVTPPTSGGAPSATILTTGGVQLAWPAAADALSGVSGYVVRRVAGATPPVAADGGTAVCAPAAIDCLDSAVGPGLWSYSFFARDGAGNISLVGVVGSVSIIDSTPPPAPTKLKATRAKAKAPSTTIAVTLHWDNPAATDLARIVVVLNLKHAPKSPSDGKAVYKGLGTSAKVKLKAGQNGYFAVYSYDHSENVSLKPARIVVKLAALIPLRPLNGSLVRTATPLLTWKSFKGTKYYNVQLFVNGKRVLVGWPTKASYRIPKGKLQPGTYVWYVWPALRGKKKGAATFGKLIGRATFRYKK